MKIVEVRTHVLEAKIETPFSWSFNRADTRASCIVEIVCEDGTTGWIFGEQVIPFEVVDEEEPGVFTRMGRGIRRAILGPSPLPYADVELSFSAGALGGEGLFLFEGDGGKCADRDSAAARYWDLQRGKVVQRHSVLRMRPRLRP